MPYRGRIDQFSSEISAAEKKYNRISMMRLFAFLVSVSGLVIVFYYEMIMFGWSIAAAGLVAFIVLIIMHSRVAERKRYLRLLLDINKNSLSRTNDAWIDFPDTGEEFADLDHPYSRDLDIFGKGSLFQLINVTNTSRGRLLLKSTLENPYQTAAGIAQMQQAVSELAEKLEWRQRFQAEGLRFNSVKPGMSLDADISRQKKMFNSRIFIYLIRLSPVLLLSSIAAAQVFDIFPPAIPILLASLQMLLIGFYFRKTNLVIRRLLKFRDMIRIFNGLISLVEREHFSSEYLSRIKNELLNRNAKKASVEIQRLETLTDIVSMRASIIHFPVNLLTMIDLQCVISFEKWCDESGVYFERWMDAIAKMETVSSLSLLRFDNPDWCMPLICGSEDGFVVSASSAAHPLIAGKWAVSNDFVSDKKGRINIITGSNMSGKSTFLRTIALNLVIAYAGAPVCARRFECSLMKIYTSMRIIDNLGKHVSSFYAELLRIKMIIDESNRKEKIFFALDELFRGTNSRDRILGARAVIKSLAKEAVTGMISTHDLELTELAKDGSSDIVNYHFRETYEQDGILFDYKIYEGVSMTSDAVYLMKKAGIEI